VQDQQRNIDLVNVCPEVRVPGRLCPDRGIGRSIRRELPTGSQRFLAYAIAEVLVEVVEVFEEAGEEGIAVRLCRVEHAISDLLWDTGRVFISFNHERPDRTDQHRLRNPV